MKMTHPVDNWRHKDVPDDLVEKFLAGGWAKAEDDAEKPALTKKRTPAKKAAASPDAN